MSLYGFVFKRMRVGQQHEYLTRLQGRGACDLGRLQKKLRCVVKKQYFTGGYLCTSILVYRPQEVDTRELLVWDWLCCC